MAICRAFSIGMCWMPSIAALTLLISAGASAQQVPVAVSSSVAASEKVKRASKEAAPQPAPTGTKFVIDLVEPVDDSAISIRELKSQHRLLIDLPQVGMSLPEQPPPGAPVGVVKSFRHMASAPGRMRIIVDLTGPVVFEKAVQKAPGGKGERLIVKIIAAPTAPPAPRLAVRTTKKVIVIDPGHGGHDSGARKFGTVEKDVVLSFSLKLKEKLDETGFYTVKMTRDTDVFVPLHERRRFAEENQAALFIAIHADYTTRASARGATIYSLRPQVAEMLKHAAGDVAIETKGKKLAGADMAEAGSVKRILSEKARDLIDRNHLLTSIFARSVIEYVGTSTNLMDNPDRKAGFAVLRTAKVPAILVELGYVTNQEDAAQLKSDEWRDRVADAMRTAINAYAKECLEMSNC